MSTGDVLWSERRLCVCGADTSLGILGGELHSRYFEGFNRQAPVASKCHCADHWATDSFFSPSPHIHINPSSGSETKDTGRERENEIRPRGAQQRLKDRRGGFPGHCHGPSPTSAGALNGWRLHTKPPSGSRCVHVPVSARPWLNIFPHFANVAQVLQPDPPASSGSLPLHRVHVPLGCGGFLGGLEVGVCVCVCVCVCVVEGVRD